MTAIDVVLAPNPGPMTLDGTNTYLIRTAAGTVVVDPGPDDESHLAAVLDAAGPVPLVLITHRHADHTGNSAALAAATGAPVRAADPAFCLGGDPLLAGERLEVGGVAIDVLGTPGHTADSVCFRIDDTVLTGDTILGRGTTVLASPDGTLTDYLNSLDVLQAQGEVTGLPAHGPVLPSLAATVRAYRAHRLERLAQVEAALTRLGPQASVAEVTDAVYTDIDPSVRMAAEQSVRVQLDHLRR